MRRPDAVVIAMPSRLPERWTRVTRAGPACPGLPLAIGQGGGCGFSMACDSGEQITIGLGNSNFGLGPTNANPDAAWSTFDANLQPDPTAQQLVNVQENEHQAPSGDANSQQLPGSKSPKRTPALPPTAPVSRARAAGDCLLTR